jgi:hypothetical protein
LVATHFPVPLSQCWAALQVTPAQGIEKQPGTHAPSTQVSWLGHFTLAQRLTTATQAARQVLPAPQVAAPPLAHGSA